MKTKTFKISSITGLLFVAMFAMGAKISDNTLKIGDSTPANNKTIQMGNGRLKWDGTASKLQFSNDTGSSFKEIGAGGGGASGINLLENADFESGSPPANWTASAGTFIAETSSPGFGLQSGSWDASAASQNLDTDLEAVPLGLEGRSCNATIQYKYSTGASGDYKLQVLNSTATVLSEVSLNATTAWVKQPIQFTCPTTNSIRIRVTSTADGGVILLDNATLGKSDFVDVSQASLVAHATYDQTGAACVWSRTSGSFGPFTPTASCPPISVSFSSQAVNAADNDLPDIVFPNLSAGTYVVEAIIPSSNSSSGSVYGFRITDGVSPGFRCSLVDASSSTGRQTICSTVFTYTSSGPRTFSLEGFAAAGSVQINTNLSNGLGVLNWKVTKFPTQSAEAINLETTGWHIDANIGGGIASLGTSAVASYTEIGHSALDLVLNTGSAPAKIPCVGVNPPTGTTCSVGDESVGVNFDVPYAGLYRACFDFTSNHGVDAVGEIVETTFQLIETPSNAQTILQEGKSRMDVLMQGQGTNATSSNKAVSVCGTFNFSSAGNKTIRLMYEQFIVGTPIQSYMLIDRQAVTGQRDLHATVFPINQGFPTPVFTDLTNSLDNKWKKPSNAESDWVSAVVALSCTGSSVLFPHAGNWIASISNQSSGECLLTTSVPIGTWAGCTVSQLNDTGSTILISTHSPVTGNPGTIKVDCSVAATGAACGGFDALLNCIYRP